MRLLRELDVKRPRHYSNTAAVVAVDLQSVESMQGPGEEAGVLAVGPGVWLLMC